MNFTRRLGIQDHELRLILGRTRIDYDHMKEEANRRKHGYSLESAVHLLERLLLPLGGSVVPHVISDPFTERGEIRHMHMSLDDSRNVVFMVTTMRGNETVRVISFRRASETESRQFQELTGYVEQEL